MTPDQRETHCDDSGVRLYVDPLKVKYQQCSVKFEVDPSIFPKIIEWLNKCSSMDKETAEELHRQAFPEQATDPYEID